MTVTGCGLAEELLGGPGGLLIAPREPSPVPAGFGGPGGALGEGPGGAKGGPGACFGGPGPRGGPGALFGGPPMKDGGNQGSLLSGPGGFFGIS